MAIVRAQADVRVPTGPVQFGDDWPGVFIRGDEALALANRMDMAGAFDPQCLSACEALEDVITLLRSCKVER